MTKCLFYSCSGRLFSAFFAVLLITLCLPGKLFAQTLSATDITKINTLVGKYVNNFYKPDSALVANSCEMGVLLVKFKVDSNSSISMVSFSKKTPQFIQAALTVAIKSFENDLYLITALKKSNKTFLLPITYSYQLGCHLDKIPAGKNFFKDYHTKWTELDHFDETFMTMFQLTDGNYDGVEGVILRTLSIGAYEIN